MNAKEARALAEKMVCSENDATYKALQNRIDIAAKNKQFAISYNDSLHPLVEARLKEEGFTVKYTSDQREGSYTTISW